MIVIFLQKNNDVGLIETCLVIVSAMMCLVGPVAEGFLEGEGNNGDQKQLTVITFLTEKW